MSAVKPVGQLRPCRDGGWLEKLPLSIDQLDGAIPAIIFMPIEVDDAGPCIHCMPELPREHGIRRRHSHPQIHVALTQQL
jgi:hypothetical protein